MTTAFDIYESARVRAGLEADDGLLDADNSVIPLLNAAFDEMSVDHDWSFNYTEDTFTTTAGQALYAPPTNWLRTAWIAEEATGNLLEFRNRRDTLRYTGRALPRYYAVVGDHLALAPTPSDAVSYIHAYYTGTPTIVRDEDGYPDVFDQLAAITVHMPSPYVTLAILFLTENIALRIKDRELYDMVNAEITDFKRRLDDNRRRQQAPGRIKTRTDI